MRAETPHNAAPPIAPANRWTANHRGQRETRRQRCIPAGRRSTRGWQRLPPASLPFPPPRARRAAPSPRAPQPPPAARRSCRSAGEAGGWRGAIRARAHPETTKIVSQTDRTGGWNCAADDVTGSRLLFGFALRCPPSHLGRRWIPSPACVCQKRPPEQDVIRFSASRPPPASPVSQDRRKTDVAVPAARDERTSLFYVIGMA